MKKHVSMPSLLKRVRQSFLKIPNQRGPRTQIPLVDCLMSGLAVFGLKMPSLLQFDEAWEEKAIRHNLQTLYQIAKAPSDTYLRERLDEVTPVYLRRAFTRIFSALQRTKALESFVYYEGHYLMPVDGTGCFSSHEVHCNSCCVKEHKDGSKTYYHQMLGAILVHPDKREVIPLAPEPILKPDGSNKNDCERNASKRLLEATRREHPHLKIIVVEDALAANAPHLKVLAEQDMRYIIGCKPDDHKYLFDFVESVFVERDQLETCDEDGTIRRYRWVNQVPLNESNADVLVNFLEYWETPPPNKKGKRGKPRHFTWITDFTLDKNNVPIIMKGGRAKWKIENETFNTLKNQGYHFEHNFGHGYKHLSTVFALLMFLAFLIDQVQQLCCAFFNAAWKELKKKSRLWEDIRFLFRRILFTCWQTFYEVVSKERELMIKDTS